MTYEDYDGTEPPWGDGTGGGDPWDPPTEGGEDPDNCYYCDGDEDTGGMDEANKEMAAKLKFSVTPSVMVDADGYKYIINLSENRAVKDQDGKDPVSDKGFKVIKMRRGGLSLDVTGDMSIAGYPGISPNIGVSVGAGIAWVTERYAATYREARTMPFITGIPFNDRRLADLAVGDSITFLVSGTIGIHAGMTIGYVTGGVEANVTGEWVTNVKKVGPLKVQVAYTRGKIGNVAITAGTIGLKAAKNWYKSLTETQAYEFDLSKPDGWKLYRRMLRGDVKAVKKYYLKELAVNRWTKYAKENKLTRRDELVRAAANKWMAKALPSKRHTLSKREIDLLNTFFQTMTVKMITIGTRQTQGSSATVRLGVPVFFSWNWNTGDKSVVIDRSREIADGLISTNYYGVYKETKEVQGVFTRHAGQTKLFMGGHQELFFLSPMEGPRRMLRMFGQMKYEFHQENMYDKNWDEQIKEAASFFGFRKELMSIPKQFDKKSKYGQFTADLLLGQKTWAYWMDYARNTGPDLLIKMGTWKVEEWFNDEGNKRTELCGGLVRPLCKKKMISEVEKSVPKAIEALKEMAASKPVGDELPKDFDKKVKFFSKFMGDFGKHFTRNQFVMNAFLDIARTSPGDQFLVFQWQGAAFPRGSKVLIPSKYFKFRGHQICGVIGAGLKDRCDTPITNRDPM